MAKELGDPEDMQKAYRVLRSVFNALRSKISPQESLQMIAQLPMFIKAVYVDGWKWNSKGAKIRKLEAFLIAVERENGLIGFYDFKTMDHTEHCVRSVFRVLKHHVSEGEIADIVGSLPAELRPLLNS